MESYEHVPRFSTLSGNEQRRIQLAASTEAIKTPAYWFPTLIQVTGFACLYFLVPRGPYFLVVLIAYIVATQWPIRWFNHNFVSKLIAKRLASPNGGDA